MWAELLRALPTPCHRAVEELTPWDVEVMYGVLGVGLYYAPELRQRCKERHGGQEPVCSVGVGRRGF